MDAADFKDYLSHNNIDELFKGLMFGLMLSQPASPVDYLIDSLKKIEEQDIHAISWKDFSDVKPKVIKPYELSKASQELDISRDEKIEIPNEFKMHEETYDIPKTSRSSVTFVEVPGLIPEGKHIGRIPSTEAIEDDISITQKPVILIIGAPESEKTLFARMIREDNPNWVIVSKFTYTIMKFATTENLNEIPMDKGFIQRSLQKCDYAECFLVVDFPTTMEQVQAFENCINVDQIVVVIYIGIDEEMSIQKCLTKLNTLDHITASIPGMVALHMNTFQEQIEPVIEHYKRIKRFIQIDEFTDQETALYEIRALINDAISGKSREDLQEQLEEMAAYRDLSAPKMGTTFPSTLSFYPIFPKCPVILLTGIPGSNKSVHAKLLAPENDKIEFILIGQMLCSGSSYANPDCNQMSNLFTVFSDGDFLPKFNVVQLIKERIDEAVTNKKLLVIIGYPKNLTQLEEFNSVIGLPELVINLECPVNDAVRVLLERSEITALSISQLLAITNDINCYRKHTLPVILYYQTMSRLNIVDAANKTFLQVNCEINDILQKYVFHVSWYISSYCS